MQQQIEQAGRKAVLVPCDISDPAQARSLVDRVASELDGLDILVNNAAYQRYYEHFDDITLMTGSGRSIPTCMPCSI